MNIFIPFLKKIKPVNTGDFFFDWFPWIFIGSIIGIPALVCYVIPRMLAEETTGTVTRVFTKNHNKDRMVRIECIDRHHKSVESQKLNLNDTIRIKCDFFDTVYIVEYYE